MRYWDGSEISELYLENLSSRYYSVIVNVIYSNFLIFSAIWRIFMNIVYIIYAYEYDFVEVVSLNKIGLKMNIYNF